MARNARVVSPCDGSLGKDAEALIRARGALSGIRADLASAFVPLGGRDYAGADLSTADLTGQLFFDKYIFRCACLRHATLSGISFIRCDLSWTDLRGAMVRGAKMSACDLRHADLRDADLRRVAFGVASDAAGWRPCDLTDANLESADLRGSVFHPHTLWPDGFDAILAGASPSAP